MKNNYFFKEKLLNKIKKGEIKMKPKVFFVLRTLGLVACTLLCLLLLVYLASFIAFWFKAIGFGLLGGFGFWGVQRIFFALPWLLILFCLALLFVFETLAKRFSFVWRKPLVYSLVLIVLFALLFAFIVSKTGFHSRLFFKAQQRELPLMGSFYRACPCESPRQIHFGKIIEKKETGFLLETQANEKLEVVLSEKTRFQLEKNRCDKNINQREAGTLKTIAEKLGEFTLGEDLAVFGERDGLVIFALGVLKLPPNFKAPDCGLINLKGKPFVKPQTFRSAPTS